MKKYNLIERIKYLIQVYKHRGIIFYNGNVPCIPNNTQIFIDMIWRDLKYKQNKT